MKISEDDLNDRLPFDPWAVNEMRAALAAKTRFVHYTRAETALKIIRNKEIWLRNASLMNDFSEVSYGWELTAKAIDSEAGQRLRRLLNQLDQNAWDDISQLLLRFDIQPVKKVYLASFSAHREDDDNLGRLSMWRAYGGQCGVALVFTPDPFFSKSNASNCIVRPVSYFTEDEFYKQFEERIVKLEEDKGKLARHNWEVLRHVLEATFIGAAICTKHPGFKEEKEWRLWTTQKLAEEAKTRGWLVDGVEQIGSVPQPIWKIPLKNPEGTDIKRSLPDILDRVIIGPTEGSDLVRDAFISVLHDAKVLEPDKKVFASNIPLRQ